MSGESLAGLLARLREAGIVFRLVDGRVRVRGWRKIPAAEKQRLSDERRDLRALLAGDAPQAAGDAGDGADKAADAGDAVNVPPAAQDEPIYERRRKSRVPFDTSHEAVSKRRLRLTRVMWGRRVAAAQRYAPLPPPPTPIRVIPEPAPAERPAPSTIRRIRN